jgi:hypothetical protein
MLPLSPSPLSPTNPTPTKAHFPHKIGAATSILPGWTHIITNKNANTEPYPQRTNLGRAYPNNNPIYPKYTCPTIMLPTHLSASNHSSLS